MQGALRAGAAADPPRNMHRAIVFNGAWCLAAALLVQVRTLSGPHPDQPPEEARLQIERINRWAFVAEMCIHGNPSGVDNTVATQGKAVVFQRTVADAFFTAIAITTPCCPSSSPAGAVFDTTSPTRKRAMLLSNVVSIPASVNGCTSSALAM